MEPRKPSYSIAFKYIDVWRQCWESVEGCGVLVPGAARLHGMSGSGNESRRGMLGLDAW